MGRVNIAWNRLGRWFWVPFLVLLGGLLSWQLVRHLPQWVEGKLSAALLESGIVATSLHVERVGPSVTVLGPSTLVYGSHVIDWEALEARYSLGTVYSGRIDHLHVEKPRLVLQFLPPPEGLPEPPPEVAGESVQPAAPAVPQQPGAGAPAAAPSLAEPMTVPEQPAVFLPGLRDRLLDIPLDGFSAVGGVVELLLQENSLGSLAFAGQMDRQPYGLSGELFLENGELLAQVSLRVPAAGNVVTLQSEAVLPPGGMVSLLNGVLPLLPATGTLPSILSSGRLVLDTLLEIPTDSPPYGSLEASMEELRLGIPSTAGQLQVRDFLLAGTLRDEALRLQGGAELHLAGLDPLSVEPFAVRLDFDPATGGSLETGSFRWSYDNISGMSAVRGFAHREEDALHLRTELAFSEVLTPGFRIEPFSLLLENSGSHHTLSASELGLKRSGTIWVEKLKADWDALRRSGSASLQLYGLSGRPMGSLAATASQPLPGTLEGTIRFLNPSGKAFLEGTLNGIGDTLDTRLSGKLALGWINTFNKWGDLGTVRFDGPDPSLDLSLSGKAPFYSGGFRIGMDGTSAWLSDDIRLEGLRGDIEMEIRSLPRTAGLQKLTIDLLSSGQFVLSDIEVDWELPTFRTLTVRRLTARIGAGYLSLKPFTIDPLDPRVRTVLSFQGLPGNELLRWLGEERFAIEGTVSGQLAIGWEEGTLVLGKGSVHLDEATPRGRFVFADPEFLKQRFASFGGVPAELKQRFLDTLQQQGIHITELSAELREADQPDHFLLRIAVSGESRTALLEVPIKGLVINNVISARDLGYLLGLLGPIRIEAQ